MNINQDYIIERKRTAQELGRWRIATFAALVIGILFFARGFLIPSNKSLGNGYIGSVFIEDIIFEDTKRDNKLQEIANNDNIKGLIVHVNSPGGTVVGSEKIYNILRKISKSKPVVVVMGTLAASGGYLISLGADHILSHNGTITGSIGVIFQTAEITDLAEKLGIKFNNFKSGYLKASPNPTEKLTPEVRDAIMANIQDTYEYFTALVSERRKIPLDDVIKIADGRIYSGRQALKLKLVDAIGDQDDAIKWMQENKQIGNLTVKEVKINSDNKLVDVLFGDLGEKISSIVSFQKLKGITSIFN